MKKKTTNIVGDFENPREDISIKTKYEEIILDCLLAEKKKFAERKSPNKYLIKFRFAGDI